LASVGAVMRCGFVSAIDEHKSLDLWSLKKTLSQWLVSGVSIKN
jgi:hypothetical protein